MLGAGILGSAVATGQAGYNVYAQYKKGGIKDIVHHRDILDAAVGTTGLVSTGLVALGLISNPVGWAIGIGALAYGVGTLIYDHYNE